MSKYIHKKGLVYKNQYHVIFCPKYRRPVLVDGVDVRLKEILLEEAKKADVTILALEIMPDHVHLFLEFDPSLWTRSYFSCTVGHVSKETIRKYIEDQKLK